MSIYAIYLNGSDENSWKLVREKWPERHFILDDRLAFVAPTETTTTQDIAENVALDDKGGLVFNWSAYGGFNSRKLWEWLAKVESE